MSKYRDTEFFQKHLADLTALERANLMLVLIDQNVMPDFDAIKEALSDAREQIENAENVIKKHFKQPR